jgi:proteasome lid subunit RPN8/RPN11
MQIAQSMYDEIVAHALADAPNECCGIIASSDGRATQVYRTTNTAHSPLKYVIDPKELLQTYLAIDDAGWELGAIYHSHTRSAPYPSQTDINLATWPEALYIIVGVHTPEPVVRAFRIVDGKVEEVELAVS